MAGIDDVLQRLVTDPAFRRLLKQDRRTALEGYALTPEDLELLASQLEDGTPISPTDGAGSGVERA